MSIRNISKSFFRSGFRGWMQGPLFRHIPHPKPGMVTGSATILGVAGQATALPVSMSVKALITPSEGKALTVEMTVKALSIQAEASI